MSNVNSPKHYVLFEYEKEGNKIKYEVIDFIRHVLSKNSELTPYQGALFFNVLKYSARTGQKGKLKEDLLKAQYYLNDLIKDLEQFEIPPREERKTPEIRSIYEKA